MTLTLSFTSGAVLISIVAGWLFIWSATEYAREPWRAAMFFALAVVLTAGLTLIGVNLS